MVSRTVARSLAWLANAATAVMRPYRKAVTRALVAQALVQEWQVETAAGTIRFHCPSARSLHDVGKLLDAEPETTRWIDGLPEGGVLWDVGANIGAFSVYAAIARRMTVVAFEPSAASYAALIRNIELNGLAGRVGAYCLALDESDRLGELSMAHTEAGASMHSFESDMSAEGRIDVAFRQPVPGLSIDTFARLFDPPPPAHIKIDVDGNEARVLRGGAATLARHTRSLMVEVHSFADPGAVDGIHGLLRGMGFRESPQPEAGTARNMLFVRP